MVQFRIERFSTVNAAGHRRDNCRLHQFYVYLSRCDFVPWTRLDDCIIVHCTRDEFPWRTCSSLSTTKYPSCKPFGVAIDALLPSTRRTIETPSFSVRCAKCNAIRHAKNNFLPLSFEWRCGFSRLEFSQWLLLPGNCTVDLRVSDEFSKKEFVEQKPLYHYLLMQCGTKRRNTGIHFLCFHRADGKVVTNGGDN